MTNRKVVRKRPVKIGGYGRVWRVRHTRSSSTAWGWCDYDKREIVLGRDTELEGVHRETLLHEALHKIMPFLDEDCVALAAMELDDILDACGHRE